MVHINGIIVELQMKSDRGAYCLDSKQAEGSWGILETEITMTRNCYEGLKVVWFSSHADRVFLRIVLLLRWCPVASGKASLSILGFLEYFTTHNRPSADAKRSN